MLTCKSVRGVACVRGWMVTLSLAAGVCVAQAQTSVERKSVALEGARKAVAAAEAEATKNSWPVVIAVVDEAGDLVLLHRSDKAQRGSIEIAIGKARTAALLKRPTAALDEASKTRPALLSATQVMPQTVIMQGGLPIMMGETVIGAVGVSGVTSQQDEQVAKAGVDAVK